MIEVKLLTRKILCGAKYSIKSYGTGTYDGSNGDNSGLSSVYSCTGAGGE